jgi:RNA polymerase sigma-70 factor (ECF subfamily)
MATDLNQFDSVEDASSLGMSHSRNLIEQARNGSDEALGELVRSLQGYLLLIANQELSSELRTKIAASDVVQNVLLRAQQNLANFRGGSRQTLLAWLRKILVNELTSTHRKYLASTKRNARREVALSADQDIGTSLVDQKRSPPSDAILEEESRKLRAAVERLPADYRTVIVLHNWQQLPFAEIGRRLDKSEDAAKKLWRRAIRRLEKEMH